MTDLKDLLDGLAGDAQVYGAIERAQRDGRRRRHRKRLAMGGVARHCRWPPSSSECR